METVDFYSRFNQQLDSSTVTTSRMSVDFQLTETMFRHIMNEKLSLIT